MLAGAGGDVGLRPTKLGFADAFFADPRPLESAIFGAPFQKNFEYRPTAKRGGGRVSRFLRRLRQVEFPLECGMDQPTAGFWMAVIGTICWGVCFWWMGRISVNQNKLIDQLREQGQRIEKLSKAEHDLLTNEVHPRVGEIKEGVNKVIAAVQENAATQMPPGTQRRS
jgi:hypothetical protein